MTNTTAPTPSADGSDLPAGAVPGALPLTGGSPGRLFLPHAVLAFASLAFLNWLISEHAPFAVKQIGASYLIAYYHVPSAILMGVAYTLVFATFVAYLLNTLALARVPSSTVAAFIFLQPLVAGTAGVLVLGEHITSPVLLAAAALLFGIALVVLDRGAAPVPPAPPTRS